MAVAFRSAASSYTDGNYYGTSPTVNAPAGLQDGDLIIVAICTGTTANLDNVLAGWTGLTEQDDGGLDSSLIVLYKIASSEGASWTFTDVLDGSENVHACALAYSGVDQTTPLDVASVAGSIANCSGDDTAEITPTSANSMVVSITSADYTSTLTGTVDASPACTERYDDENDGSNLWIYVQDHLQSAAVAEAHTITPSSTDSVAYRLLALREAAAAGGISIPVVMYNRRLMAQSTD